ncbi:MAG: sensor histidine kinase [Bacillota bacterium]|jgi:signal transduction histidine kinase
MRSIRGKLWLGMMALVTTILLALWLLQIVFLESFYANMRIADIKRQLTTIGEMSGQGSRSDVEFELDRLASVQNLTIEWLDEQGRSLHLSSGDQGWHMPMMRHVTRSLYEGALSGQAVQLTAAHPRFGSEYTLLGLPLPEGRGAFIVTVPMAAVAETATILKRQLGYVTVLLLALTAALSLWLARGFSLPILQMRRAAASMAKGDFSARVEYTGQDEIGALAASINHLGERLAKIEQLRRDLVANVSHDLRTPLSVIRGYAETIRDISGDDRSRREAELQVIIEETERLTNLVDHNLQLALLQSGNAEVNRRAFSVADLLQDLADKYAVIAQQQGIGLQVQAHGDLAAMADEAKIAQVIQNLLQNSLQHTGSGGSIALKAAAEGDKVRVSVSDTGSGISPSDLPHIWEKYYQGQASDGRASDGSGLGLAIVKGILDAHQAEHHIDSQEGIGTTVWFDLDRYRG